jgi:hypothetical protein
MPEPSIRTGVTAVMFRMSSKYAPHPSSSGSAADRSPEARRDSPVCPQCKSSVNRVPRRFIDRLLSLFLPVHRYHCRSFICHWEGNLLYPARPSDGWEVAPAPSPTEAPATSVAPDASIDRPATANVPIPGAPEGKARRAPRPADPVV